jgi:hypothetical protein
MYAVREINFILKLYIKPLKDLSSAATTSHDIYIRPLDFLVPAAYQRSNCTESVEITEKKERIRI